jgi:uridine kinase
MLVIAIAGGSGSGKTSVASRLADAISSDHQCDILCEDSYYKTLTPEQHANISEVNFDHPDALDHQQLRLDLLQLKDGNDVAIPTYCYKTHSRLTDTRAMQACDVLILEGLHLLHRASLLPLYDMAVYVDTPTDVRLARRLARDVSERQRSPESVHYQFNTTVEPCHQEFIQPSKKNACITINGTLPFNDFMPDLITQVSRKLS